MNFKEIKELIEILDKSTLTEINIEDTKGKVTLKKEKKKLRLSRHKFHKCQLKLRQCLCLKYNQLIAIKLKLQSQLQIITKQLMHLW